MRCDSNSIRIEYLDRFTNEKVSYCRIESLGVVTFLSLFNATSETLDTYLSPEDIEALKQEDKDKW